MTVWGRLAGEEAVEKLDWAKTKRKAEQLVVKWRSLMGAPWSVWAGDKNKPHVKEIGCFNCRYALTCWRKEVSLERLREMLELTN